MNIAMPGMKPQILKIYRQAMQKQQRFMIDIDADYVFEIIIIKG